jgi:predicted MFS family arabinose efflux permease
MSLVQRYPRSWRVVRELALYAVVIGGVFVLYAYVLPLVGLET